MKFSAKTVDGRVLTERDFRSVSELPLDEVCEILVEDGGFPPVTIAADVAGGERIRYFARNIIPVGVPGSDVLRIPVYEIKKDDRVVCRLYWHPKNGPLLTTRDVYFR